ncbi:hypothetical protein CDD81_6869 [Ophiocordyceps australis]|uniref:Succinate dehydrogenase cytochrome b560 subunit n=1 Tax=Ophiocordyceps australis TaxID=1399860 RepID=A0A2C5XZF5_9HYPO|nr:hypothetical protein CDD81_6869 [Ophiocordyceps australis]
MNAQRVGLAALRKGIAHTPSLARTSPAFFLAARLCSTPTRPFASSTHISTTEANQILAAQRRHRPVSPHLGIYKINQTWFGASAWTRITGCTLSGAVYAYFAAYLVAPLLGLHIESASLAAAFATWPVAAKGALKLALSFPFAFHFFAGCKHLLYDMGKGFAKQTIRNGEIALWGVSIASALYLAFGL